MKSERDGRCLRIPYPGFDRVDFIHDPQPRSNGLSAGRHGPHRSKDKSARLVSIALLAAMSWGCSEDPEPSGDGPAAEATSTLPSSESTPEPSPTDPQPATTDPKPDPSETSPATTSIAPDPSSPEAAATTSPSTMVESEPEPEPEPTPPMTPVEPEPPQQPMFEGLPIPIAFVGATDSENGITLFGAPVADDDCPKGMARGKDGSDVEQVVWSDCVAELTAERINAEYQKLLGTDQVLFESAGYTAVEMPAYAQFDSRDEVSAALEAWADSELAIPGTLTAVVSNWTHSLGGLARRDSALDDEHAIVLAISQLSGFSVIHEVGHAIGFPHTDEDENGDRMLHYDFCGEISAPVLDVCNCERNMMEAEVGGCPECSKKEYSLVTETHGDFFRDIATCWFSDRRFAGERYGCSVDGLATCEGYTNTSMTCSCYENGATFEVDECQDLVGEDAETHYATCGTERPTREVCERYDAYPGVGCIEDGEGSNTCYCFDGDDTFTSAVSCGGLTDEDVFTNCLPNPVVETCSGSAAGVTVNCAEDSEGVLSCICTDSGAIVQVNRTCSEADVGSMAESCP